MDVVGLGHVHHEVGGRAEPVAVGEEEGVYSYTAWSNSILWRKTVQKKLSPGSAGPQSHLIHHKPLLPGRFCAVQQGPQPPAPAAHASASNSRGRLPHSCRGHGRGRALARRYQRYGGTRFVEDDLAGDPEAGALASNGQGPPSITDRLRSTADGAQAAADLIGAGAAGLAAAQAFRSQLPQDAAEYVRLNVLPRPGQAQPPPQIIGRPSDVERLLDEAGQRTQEVERGAAQAVETAAVAAEEGEVAVAAEGVGGAFVPGGPGRRGRCPGAHRGRGCWNAGWRGGSWCGGNGGAGRGHCGRRSLRPRAWHGLGAGEHALPAPAEQRGRGRAGRPVRQRHE